MYIPGRVAVIFLAVETVPFGGHGGLEPPLGNRSCGMKCSRQFVPGYRTAESLAGPLIITIPAGDLAAALFKDQVRASHILTGYCQLPYLRSRLLQRWVGLFLSPVHPRPDCCSTLCH